MKRQRPFVGTLPTLYEQTGNILDVNTIVINRAELREYIDKQLWEHFYRIHSENAGMIDKDGNSRVKNFLGSVESHRKEFLDAVDTII